MITLTTAQESLEDSIVMDESEIFDLLCEAVIALGYELIPINGRSGCLAEEKRIYLHVASHKRMMDELAHELVHALQGIGGSDHLSPLGWPYSQASWEVVVQQNYQGYYHDFFISNNYEEDVVDSLVSNYLIAEAEAVDLAQYPLFVARTAMQFAEIN